MSMIILLVLLVVFGFYVVGLYNGLVGARNNYKNAFAQIDVQLTRRHDLIPNLVEVAKGYMAHERGTLEAVIQARNKAAQGGVNSGDEAQLRVSLDKLLALSEAYPDLKANTNFQELQRELADVEDKLAAARRALNAAVSRYNAAIETFPAVLFAGVLGFRAADFNRLDDSEKGTVDQVPQVRF